MGGKRCRSRSGRAGYRISAGDRQMILIPGLTVAGRVDLDALDNALDAAFC